MERDFTNAHIDKLRMYAGANGNKLGIVYQGENYMLKFPPKASRNPAMNYSNSCISEYVACHIFASLGIETQETFLGKYGDKVTVACKDFSINGFAVKEFAQLKNTILDSEQNGYGTELSDIIRVIHEQQIFSPVVLEEHFWNMFVADTLLGNFDRHNGNWGFLINAATGEVMLAPVFDCGSCLYPQIQEAKMDFIIQSRKEMDDRIYVYPTSAIQLDGKKINYAHFLLSTDNEGCIKALKAVGGRIDMRQINSIIDDTPFISDTYKRFLKTMIKERKEHLIDKSLERFGSGTSKACKALPK